MLWAALRVWCEEYIRWWDGDTADRETWICVMVMRLPIIFGGFVCYIFDRGSDRPTDRATFTSSPWVRD